MRAQRTEQAGGRAWRGMAWAGAVEERHGRADPGTQARTCGHPTAAETRTPAAGLGVDKLEPGILAYQAHITEESCRLTGARGRVRAGRGSTGRTRACSRPREVEEGAREGIANERAHAGAMAGARTHGRKTAQKAHAQMRRRRVHTRGGAGAVRRRSASLTARPNWSSEPARQPGRRARRRCRC